MTKEIRKRDRGMNMEDRSERVMVSGRDCTRSRHRSCIQSYRRDSDEESEKSERESEIKESEELSRRQNREESGV